MPEPQRLELVAPGSTDLEPAGLGSHNPGPVLCRSAILEDLRRALPRLEGRPRAKPAFRFGIAGLDAHLPQGGLAGGALHEIIPADESDFPAAFAFLASLLGRIREEAPLLLVLSRRGLADHGAPYGHGLNALGLDPARLILAEAGDEKGALWAIEEGLRSAVPAAVAGAIGKGLDLKTSRRLHLAAGGSGLPLLLMLPPTASGTSAAATRWRIDAAAAARDPFGLLVRPRWRLRLERCRNGRPGEWLVEFDHAYRFSLADALADPALPLGAGEERRGAA
jgi:protein ImuA